MVHVHDAKASTELARVSLRDMDRPMGPRVMHPSMIVIDSEPPLWVRYTIPLSAVALFAFGVLVHYLFTL